MKRLPNVVSTSRIPLGIVIFLASSTQQWNWAWWAFLIAALSDLIDGPLARLLNAVSQTGSKLDRTGDAVLLIGTIVGLVLGGAMPAVLLVDVAIGSILGIFMARGPSGSMSQHQFVLGICTFVAVLFGLGSRLLTLAYGWHWWYILVGAVGLVVMTITKRGRLSA